MAMAAMDGAARWQWQLTAQRGCNNNATASTARAIEGATAMRRQQAARLAPTTMTTMMTSKRQRAGATAAVCHHGRCQRGGGRRVRCHDWQQLAATMGTMTSPHSLPGKEKMTAAAMTTGGEEAVGYVVSFVSLFAT